MLILSVRCGGFTHADFIPPNAGRAHKAVDKRGSEEQPVKFCEEYLIIQAGAQPVAD
jgi:hypothetical protein